MKEDFSTQKMVDNIMPLVQIGGINDRKLFENAISFQHSKGLPIQVAGFIGQGGKDHLGRSDMTLLDKYKGLQNSIVSYPYGVEVSLIGADLHGEANSIEDRGYLQLMHTEAQRLGFNWKNLSELYKEKNVQLPNLDQVQEILKNKNGGEYKRWIALPLEIKSAFIKQAQHHWGENSVLGAFYYFVMRQREFQIFQPGFENFLFVINGKKEQAEHVFPKVISQMYWIDVRDGGRKGRNMAYPPPWFRDD